MLAINPLEYHITNHLHGHHQVHGKVTVQYRDHQQMHGTLLKRHHAAQGHLTERPMQASSKHPVRVLLQAGKQLTRRVSWTVL